VKSRNERTCLALSSLVTVLSILAVWLNRLEAALPCLVVISWLFCSYFVVVLCCVVLCDFALPCVVLSCIVVRSIVLCVVLCCVLCCVVCIVL
jgi:hypothetical protein